LKGISKQNPFSVLSASTLINMAHAVGVAITDLDEREFDDSNAKSLDIVTLALLLLQIP
jgi:hypothetical protein